MKIIGIETSSIQGGVAVMSVPEADHAEGRPASGGPSSGTCGGETHNKWWCKEQRLTKGLVHGKLLIPALDKLLKKLDWKKEDINLIAVDIGPGSYTGLRVGLAIAKTMAHFLKIKVIGVSSFDVLLLNVEHAGDYNYICPVIDARWNQVYTALYDSTNKRITDYLVMHPDELTVMLKRYLHNSDETNIVGSAVPRCIGAQNTAHYTRLITPQCVKTRPVANSQCILVFGDGLGSYQNTFSKIDKRISLGIDNELWIPKASNVALLGYLKYIRGTFSASYTTGSKSTASSKKDICPKKTIRYSRRDKNDDITKLLPLYLRPTEAEINLRVKQKTR